MKITFGQKLRDERRAASISQRDLADKVGVDYTYISKVENDRLPPPSAETIEKIAEILGIMSSELLAYAKKIPTEVRDTLSSNSEAIKFISEATNMNLSKEEWGQLTENLKRLR
ncbi:MAG: helix-turn-helix domain-containing protein [Bacteroidetes bacterium]|nr:helix-turn-helix domain-containing protein [Bacteroidota bacterium]